RKQVLDEAVSALPPPQTSPAGRAQKQCPGPLATVAQFQGKLVHMLGRVTKAFFLKKIKHANLFSRCSYTWLA
ncbi:hypothetical protein ACVGWL_00765, partial [Enterobacter asburiae]